MCCSISLPSGRLSRTSFLKLTGRSLSLAARQQGAHQINLSTFSCNGTFTLKTQFTWGGESPGASGARNSPKIHSFKKKKAESSCGGWDGWDWTEWTSEVLKKQNEDRSARRNKRGATEQTSSFFIYSILNPLCVPGRIWPSKHVMLLASAFPKGPQYLIIILWLKLWEKLIKTLKIGFRFVEVMWAATC